MKKKKEITLQDLFENMQNMYTGLCSSIDMLTFRLNQVLEKTAEISECSKMEQPDAEKNSESEIPNTAYVTLTEDGCFVGGEPTTQYNGEDIYRPYLCVAYFKEARDIIRKEYGYELLELHCLQSSTEGKYAKTGNPIPDKDGTYAWLRAVYKNKEDKVVSSLWAFNAAYGNASDCASNCASDCGNYVQYYAGLRGGLFGSVA